MANPNRVLARLPRKQMERVGQQSGFATFSDAETFAIARRAEGFIARIYSPRTGPRGSNRRTHYVNWYAKPQKDPS